MKRIFITATNTNIGKTYTTKRLIEYFSKKNLRVGVFKPIESGVEEIPLDGNELFNTALKFNGFLDQLSLDDIVPIQLKLPAAPFVAFENRAFDLELIDKALKKIEQLCDIVLIEGAGGLFVPIAKDLMMIDLIEHFNAKTLLVSHCNLGSINDTLLSEFALKNRKLEFVTAHNCKKEEIESFEKISYPYFQTMRKPPFLLHSQLDEIADALID